MSYENQTIDGFFCPNRIVLDELKAKSKGRSATKSNKDSNVGPSLFDRLAPNYERLQSLVDPSRFAVHSMMLDILNVMKPSPVNILDLGCATGQLTQQILELLPESRVYAIDGSLAMLQKARENVEEYSDRAVLIKSDFRDGWEEAINEPLDVIVHYGALRYLPHYALKEMYARLHKVLKPEGYFLTGDTLEVVIPREAGILLESIEAFRTHSFMLDLGEDAGLLDELEKMKHEHEEMWVYPATAEQHIAWMIDAGFEFVTRIYQDWKVSLFIARKG